jgi:hypothetical protein
VAAARCREEEEGEKQREKRVRVGFYRRAQPEKRGRAQDGGRRRRALGCVAAARLRRPDVARRGEDSGGGAAVGGVVGRHVEGGSGSRGRTEAEELGDSRKTMEDLSAISQKSRDPTVMYR